LTTATRPSLLTLREVARILAVDERTARRLCKGTIPSYRVGGVRRIAPEDLDRYLTTVREG
jgi:excisionase family DNA binding protein